MQACQQHGALDLRAGHVGVNSTGVSELPIIVSGSEPFVDSKRAPMRDSGSMTRFIGRRRSDSSPVIVGRERVGGKRAGKAVAWSSRNCRHRGRVSGD